MEHWWLYVLVFMFGYLTHKTFYFFRSVKISIGLIRVSQLISLAVLARSMESFYYAHTARLRQMRENNDSDEDIKDARRSFNAEISIYKEKAINEMLDFDNWKSAMKYLEDNKPYVIALLSQDKNDKKTS